MECLITRLTTKTKWRNRPLHPVVIRKAKKIKETSKNAIIWILQDLQKDFNKRANAKFNTGKDVDNVEYAAFIDDFFRIDK